MALSSPVEGRNVRFGPFELDLRSGELRKNGSRVGLQDQPLQILSVLLERPSELVTREELRQRLWPADTFVDFEHGLNAAVKRLRDALGDSADTPRFVETIPRRGYRFIGAVDGMPRTDESSRVPRSARNRNALGLLAWTVAFLAIAVAAYLGYRLHRPPPMTPQRMLTRLTFAPGSQIDPSWSPDGHLIAYASDQSGNFDVWVQPVAGGRAIQVTDDPAHDWQPDWSPDGKLLVFRSERDGGGLYVVPPLGGASRKLCSFGVRPRWSPDAQWVLFGSPVRGYFGARPPLMTRPFVVGLDGGPPQQVSPRLLPGMPSAGGEFAWHPDGRLSYSSADHDLGHPFDTLSLDGGAPVRSNPSPGTGKSFEDLFLTGFAWASSGRALYFTMDARHRFGTDQVNLWRIDVDPETLRWIGGPHRLTTGPGADTELDLSPDGKSLAFSQTTARTRIMSLGVDHRSGRAIGGLEAHTGAEANSFGPDITGDGKALVFMRTHPEGAVANELRRKSLTDGRETVLNSWGPFPTIPERRGPPRLSPDGRYVAYGQCLGPPGRPPDCALVIADVQTGTEQQGTRRMLLTEPYDWSDDGQSLLASLKRGSEPFSIWLLPLSGAPQADRVARLVAADAINNLWQARFSPDGRWIAFIAEAGRGVSTIYVVSSSGGPWMQITEGQDWDDKPRWSPDGRRLYFLSARHGAMNVWSIAFDPAIGVPLGEPSPVTAFNGPGLMISDNFGVNEIAVSTDRLFLPMQEVTGALWMLNNVDQ